MFSPYPAMAVPNSAPKLYETASVAETASSAKHNNP